jgi:hypothetical protein
MKVFLEYLPSSPTSLSLIALGFAALVILFLTIKLMRRKKDTLPIQEVAAKDIPSLLTQPELACFNTLDSVAGKDYYIMAKVSLGDIAVIKKGVDQSRLKKASKSHIDFILCDRTTLAVVCAIELEDIGSAASSRKDTRSADLLQEVGVMVFRLPVRTTYSMPEIQQMLTPYLKGQSPSPDEMVATVSMEAFRSCKTCKERMVLKRAKSGKYKGVLFWVCSRYPACKTFELFIR